jgi:hypothetical protein
MTLFCAFSASGRYHYRRHCRHRRYRCRCRCRPLCSVRITLFSHYISVRVSHLPRTSVGRALSPSPSLSPSLYLTALSPSVSLFLFLLLSLVLRRCCSTTSLRRRVQRRDRRCWRRIRCRGLPLAGRQPSRRYTRCPAPSSLPFLSHCHRIVCYSSAERAREAEEGGRFRCLCCCPVATGSLCRWLLWSRCAGAVVSRWTGRSFHRSPRPPHSELAAGTVLVLVLVLVLLSPSSFSRASLVPRPLLFLCRSCSPSASFAPLPFSRCPS